MKKLGIVLLALVLSGCAEDWENVETTTVVSKQGGWYMHQLTKPDGSKILCITDVDDSTSRTVDILSCDWNSSK